MSGSSTPTTSLFRRLRPNAAAKPSLLDGISSLVDSPAEVPVLEAFQTVDKLQEVTSQLRLVTKESELLKDQLKVIKKELELAHAREDVLRKENQGHQAQIRVLHERLLQTGVPVVLPIPTVPTLLSLSAVRPPLSERHIEANERQDDTNLDFRIADEQPPQFHDKRPLDNGDDSSTSAKRNRSVELETGAEDAQAFDDDHEVTDAQLSLSLSSSTSSQAVADLDNLEVLHIDGTYSAFSTLSDEIKDALRQWIVNFPDWLKKIRQSKGKRCVAGKGAMQEHVIDGYKVACKMCAANHEFCIKKFEDRIVLTPLCVVDRVGALNTQVLYYKVADSVYTAPSKTYKPKLYKTARD